MPGFSFDFARDPLRVQTLFHRNGEECLPPYAAWADLVGYSPTWLTRSQEASGNAKDAVANNDLTAAGTIIYNNYREGKRGLAITANTSGFNANVNDFANTNSVMGIWFAMTDAVAAQRTIIGRYATTIYLLGSIQSSAAGGGLANKPLIQSTDGAVAASFTLGKVVTDGVIRLLLVHRDRTMNKMRARISRPGEAAVTGEASITTQGTLTGGAGPGFNYGYAAALQNGDDCWLGGAFCRINADQTGADLLARYARGLGAE